MVQAHTSHPCEKLGYTIGIGLAQELANSRSRFAEQILEELSGIHIARTSKDNMMLILNGIIGILI